MTADSSPATATPALTVTVFSKNDCAICINTERAFDRKGVPYVEINVEKDTAPRDEFGGLTPFEYVVANYGRQMPVVVVTDEELGWTESWSGGRMDKWMETIQRFADADLLIPEDERA